MGPTKRSLATARGNRWQDLNAAQSALPLPRGGTDLKPKTDLLLDVDSL